MEWRSDHPGHYLTTDAQWYCYHRDANNKSIELTRIFEALPLYSYFCGSNVISFYFSFLSICVALSSSLSIALGISFTLSLSNFINYIGFDSLNTPNLIHTVCPRSSYPFYIVTYCLKWITTSWTYSTCTQIDDKPYNKISSFSLFTINVIYYLTIYGKTLLQSIYYLLLFIY